MKRASVVFSSIVIIAIIIGIFVTYHQHQEDVSGIINTAALDSLSTKGDSIVDTSHLANGLIPPTNKWFSGIALQKEPKAVFPSPLSFLPKNSLFEIGLPQVTTTAKMIIGHHSPDITVSVATATSYRITRYDEMSVDLTYMSDSKTLGTVTLTAGSPYIFFTATKDVGVTIPATQATIKDNRAIIAGNLSSTIIAGFDKAKMEMHDSNIAIHVPAGSFITFYKKPNAMPDTLAPFAGNRITKTIVSYGKVGDSYQTTVTPETANNQPTAFGFLPHQNTKDKLSELSYDTIYGISKIAIGSAFHFTTAAIRTASSLDITKLSDSDRQLLSTTLRRDINATTFVNEDTYFGGKSLYRAAQLLDLARQLHENEIADSIQQKLRREFDTWLSPSPRLTKSFYYDTKIRGIVGQKVAFGSENFNDHHFHYGYFIYAASILAKYDDEFLNRNKAVINLLVADIANYKINDKLPFRRVFDPYFGHSWASGSSPFNDGNNQESSSEAINAWIGINLWAKQIDDKVLLNESGWMLSNEVASTALYWLNIDKNTRPYTSEYKPSIVSMNWGGKREYATFFSDKPNALLGILLIPMSPSTVYQTAYGDKIAQQVNEAMPTVDINAQFIDYILMYSALDKKTNQLEIAKSLPDIAIDGANSRSYLYAWLMTRP